MIVLLGFEGCVYKERDENGQGEGGTGWPREGGTWALVEEEANFYKTCHLHPSSSQSS